MTKHRVDCNCSSKMWRLQPTFRAKKKQVTPIIQTVASCCFPSYFFVVVVATVCYSKTISLWFWLHELVCVRPHKWPQKCLSIFFYINCGQYSINLNYITVKLIGTGISAMRSKCAAHCSIQWNNIIREFCHLNLMMNAFRKNWTVFLVWDQM